MARIRSIKPEILEDENTAGLSDPAFRLFVAVICLADDHGNVRADSRWLEGQVWWARRDSPRVSAILTELSEAGLVQLYIVRKQAYCHLKGWTKHQRIDNAGKPKVPTPEEADEPTICDPERLAEIRGEMPLDRDQDQEGDREREGERSERSTRRSRGEGRRPPWSDAERLAIASVLESLAQYSEVRYSLERADKPTESAKLVLARLREGVTEMELRAINGYCAYPVASGGLGWQGDAKMAKFLRPETLYGSKNIERYLDPARAWFRRHFGEDAA